MKTILLFLLISGNLFTQNFTNGSVYNFSIGDTIVTAKIEHQGLSESKSTFHYQVFTGKHFSLNGDTVFYDISSYFYTPPTCIGCNALSSYNNWSLSVTDLNASVINYTPSTGPCGPVKDSSYVNDCGFNEHLKTISSATCGSTMETKFIEGIGVFNFARCWNCLPTGAGQETKLIAAHKAGKPACGNVVFVIAGLKDHYNQTIFSIFPNPGNGEFTLNCRDEGSLLITNSLGSIVSILECRNGVNSIDLSGCDAGIYFLQYHSSGNVSFWKYLKN